MFHKLSPILYVLLFVGWLAISVWQHFEHQRVETTSRNLLINRANDISMSLGVVIRSQSHFVGVIKKPRLEAALKELVASSELESVILLNQHGEEVTRAGEGFTYNRAELMATGFQWGDDYLTIANPVSLGPGVETSDPNPAPILIDDRPTSPPPAEPFDPNRSRAPRDGRPRERNRDSRTSTTLSGSPSFPPPPPEDPSNQRGPGSGSNEDDPSDERGGDRRRDWGRDRREDRGAGGGPPRPGSRPWEQRQMWSPDRIRDWLTQQGYQGIHDLVLTMSTAQMNQRVRADAQLRFILSGVAFIAAIGLALAWRAMERSTKLQVGLVRAQELNKHLKEMNVAAAGLAHETRNPLNIIRGLTQMISRGDLPREEAQAKAQAVLEEVDRITSRLNEFIDYSKPPSARLAPTSLHNIARDVARTLDSDREDKNIQLTVSGPPLLVEADESLLRQVIFNLQLNACQNVNESGQIEVVTIQHRPDEGWLEVRDTGPGVPPEAREDIFRPYFTLQKTGTGLGLAVVRQIVLAHRWEIEYVTGTNGGATFRIRGMKIVA